MSNDRNDLRGKPGPGTTDLMGLGVQFAATLVAFLFLGRWLDGRLGTAPWLTVAGVFVGFGLSLLWLFARLRAGGPPKGGGR